MNYEYITVEMESNSREFMRTRKIPPNTYPELLVSWVEEWEDKDGEKVELEFTRKQWDRDKSYSFAFKLASGLQTSLSRTKVWEGHYSTLKGEDWERWQEFKDLYKSRVGHPPPRVVRVVLSVMFRF